MAVLSLDDDGTRWAVMARFVSHLLPRRTRSFLHVSAFLHTEFVFRCLSVGDVLLFFPFCPAVLEPYLHLKHQQQYNMYKQKSAHPLITGESLKTTTPKESSFNNHLLLSKNLLSVVSGTLIAKAECVIGKKWTVNWYHVWGGNRYAQYASV